MKQLIIIAALMLGVGLAISADAEDKKDRPEPPTFAEIDTNSDQLLSSEEVKAAMQARMNERRSRRGRGHDPEARFARADTDNDGYLNAEEFDAVRAEREERRPKRHRRGGDCEESDASE